MGTYIFKSPYSAEALWRPYYEITYTGANGTAPAESVGKFQTQCPRLLRYTVLTNSSDDSTVLSTESQMGLITVWTGSWNELALFDCEGKKAGSVSEDFSQSFMNRYGFSTDFTLKDSTGATIGRTAGVTFGSGSMQVFDASSTLVATVSWSWANRFRWLNSYLTINFQNANTAVGMPHILAACQQGFNRIALSSNAEVDNCSRFIIIGIPILVIIQLVGLCVSFSMASNKAMGLLGGEWRE